jgi:hypothetical protein
MKKKHPGIVVFILVLMLVASFGAYSETFLRAGMDYDSAVLYSFLYSILGMSFSAVIAMFIPFVCRLVCGHRLSYKSGKVICTINDDTYLSPIKLVCKCYDEHPGKSIPESICEDMGEFIKYFENSSKYSRICSDFEEKQN